MSQPWRFIMCLSYSSCFEAHIVVNVAAARAPRAWPGTEAGAVAVTSDHVRSHSENLCHAVTCMPCRSVAPELELASEKLRPTDCALQARP